MIIRVDKCSSFGIKKALSKSIQYLPKLLIDNQLIPPVDIDNNNNNNNNNNNKAFI